VRWLLVAILGYACLVLQTAAFRPGGLAVHVFGHSMRPDLVLLLGLFLALYVEPYEIFVVAWVLGMASDLVSVTGRLGLQALLFCLALTGLSYLRGNLNRERILVQMGLALGAVLAIHFLGYVATQFLQGSPMSILQAAAKALLDAVYSAVLAPYLFWLLQLLRGPLGVAGTPRE